MRRFLRMSSIVALSLGFLLSPTGQPEARAGCSCLIYDQDELVFRASAIFVGTAVSAAEPETADPEAGFRPVEWTFEVSDVLKGDIGEVHVLQTPESPASCGLDVEVGSEYLVFTATASAARAYLCDGTRFLDPMFTDDVSVADLVVQAPTTTTPDAAAPAQASPSLSESVDTRQLLAIGGAAIAALALIVTAWVVIRRRRDPYRY